MNVHEWPVAVGTVEASSPTDVDCRSPSGAPSPGAKLLVMHGDRPLGYLEITGPVGWLPAAVVGRLVAERFGPLVERPPFRFPSVAPPFASVIVPSNVRCRAALAGAVARLEQLDYPSFEVIVVDNRSRPDEALRDELSSDKTRVVHEPCPGISAARNRGISEARGEVVAFTDDDDAVDLKWLRALAGHFSDPAVVACMGILVPSALETFAQVWFEASARTVRPRFEPARVHFDGIHSIRTAPGERPARDLIYAMGDFGAGCMAMRASALRDLHGFDEALGVGTRSGAGDDLQMLVRLLCAGGTLVVEPGAIVYRGLRPTLDELEGQLRAYGRGFTAMLTSLLLENPRLHLRALLASLPRAVASVSKGVDGRGGRPRTATERRLLRADRVGMLGGPVAYLRARRSARSCRRGHPSPLAGAGSHRCDG